MADDPSRDEKLGRPADEELIGTGEALDDDDEFETDEADDLEDDDESADA